MNEYWVEAHTVAKGRVTGYGVWRETALHGRQRVAMFWVRSNRSWRVALHLANIMRDDLNAKVA